MTLNWFWVYQRWENYYFQNSDRDLRTHSADLSTGFPQTVWIAQLSDQRLLRKMNRAALPDYRGNLSIRIERVRKVP